MNELILKQQQLSTCQVWLLLHTYTNVGPELTNHLVLCKA
ncbi:unnamed protein product [Fusarium graminearum]|uniref:Chromosome 1, complete genome n=1 Tax=Gibberella zeae (strain ATCC MYA-4620 / CBS 123657 / FGSC 9075 / NRRL 31084 / PH-1) TaxID=229533 RepID=A0A0E0RU59_GIBZE|nr:hypothetical protein FG05_35130 [Fusarium graminearum]CEF74784.1 unnamed protein product [Fusarium graminearum]